MQFPITIGLHRSFILATGFVSTHAIAAVAISLPAWEIWLKFLLFVGLAGSAWWSQKLCTPGVGKLRLFKDGRMECSLAGDDPFQEAKLLPGMMVHHWLTVIRLEIGETTMTVAVLSDSAAREELRRLRIWLRWRAEFSASEGDV